MSCEVDLRGLERAQAALAQIDGGFEKALSHALADAARKGRTAASKEIRKKYNISAAGIKGGISLKGGGLSRTLVIKGSPLSLLEFKPRATKTHGVTVTIKRGNKKTLNHAFLIPKYAGAFERKTKKRFPIKKLYTVSVAQMGSNAGVKDSIQTICADTFEVRLEHYVEAILGGIL